MAKCGVFRFILAKYSAFSCVNNLASNPWLKSILALDSTNCVNKSGASLQARILANISLPLPKLRQICDLNTASSFFGCNVTKITTSWASACKKTISSLFF